MHILTQGGGKMKKRHTFFLFVTVVFIFFSAQAYGVDHGRG